MAKIFDYVLKYYSPIEPNGRQLMNDDDWNYIRHWALWNAQEKLKEVLGFGDKVTIEPLREDLYIGNNRFAMNGYKVTAQGQEHYYRIEPRIREAKSQAWRGI